MLPGAARPKLSESAKVEAPKAEAKEEDDDVWSNPTGGRENVVKEVHDTFTNQDEKR